jgi:hypothetical protein
MKTKIICIFALFCVISTHIIAQEEEGKKTEQNFSLSADLVSNYVWRGLALSEAPNIQPNFAFTSNNGKFSTGAFGSYSFGDYYSEVDLFLSYEIGSFSVQLWDYFVMNQVENNRFFHLDDESTGHALEGVLTYSGPESFPIMLTAGTYFYGADKDSVGENYYSTYFEAAYPFTWKANNLTLFIGLTPWEGLYASDFAVNNIGISNSREIKINDRFSIPIKGSLIFNPNLENVYFVIGITLAAND